MKIKPIFILTILTLLVCSLALASCSPSREKTAEETFNDAIDAYMARKFNKAKILLDSVIYNFPDNKKIVKESRDMLTIIYKTEQERNLIFLDSLLQVREQELKPLRDLFEAEDPLAENSVLIHKKQSASRAWDRSYLRAHVDKNGTFYISSHYTGNGYISHYAVKAVVNNSFQITDSINDDAYCHRFDDGENYWETIKFKNNSDNGLATFIATNFDKPVDVIFIGPRTNYKIRMTETDRFAFRDTYQLAMMLREIVQIKSQIRNVRTTMKKKFSDAN